MAPNENVLNAFYAFDKTMLEAHRRGDHAEAEGIAHELLSHAELPLIIRARAGMVLACSDEPDFLDRAKEALRIAEIAATLKTEHPNLAQQLVEDCKTVLKESQERYETLEVEKLVRVDEAEDVEEVKKGVAVDKAEEMGVEQEGSVEGNVDGESDENDGEVVLRWVDGEPVAVGSHFANERSGRAPAQVTRAAEDTAVAEDVEGERTTTRDEA